MKNDKKSKKTQKKQKPGEKEIGDMIDGLAYQDEKKNIRKSKSFLDNLYLLDQ
ncbi:MAG: hypothetical protein PSV16_14675 [Flavobacterium sp.]|nr:hypothetical protein [Flavobacterium sp.]